MGIPAYLYHPMAVHFPIALLALGMLAALGSLIQGGRADWLRPASLWILGLGTLGLWAALGLGLLAARTAPHVPAAWRVMALHRQLAWSSAVLFSVLTPAWAYARGKARWAVLLAWLLAYGVLAYTAHQGARLVFEFGLGSAGG